MGSREFQIITLIVSLFWYAMALLEQGQNVEHTLFRLSLFIFFGIWSAVSVICEEVNKNKQEGK